MAIILMNTILSGPFFLLSIHIIRVCVYVSILCRIIYTWCINVQWHIHTARRNIKTRYMKITLLDTKLLKILCMLLNRKERKKREWKKNISKTEGIQKLICFSFTVSIMTRQRSANAKLFNSPHKWIITQKHRFMHFAFCLCSFYHWKFLPTLKQYIFWIFRISIKLIMQSVFKDFVYRLEIYYDGT